MREVVGCFSDCGPLAEDSAAKLKESAKVVYCVPCTLSPLLLKSVPDCMTSILLVVDNSKVCSK